MNFSLEHQNPLVTGGITGLRDSYPGPTFSLLNTGDPNVLLWSLKPSEEGMKEGLIARFWNFNTRSVRQPLRSPDRSAGLGKRRASKPMSGF